MDDKGLLQPNEVFVQVRAPIKPSKKDSLSGSFECLKDDEAGPLRRPIFEVSQILQGKILVTRNPCTHPGDIRLLSAIDVPELRYLENVIVFPSTGDRPLCNMMAGGDLDGDVYFVCWDEALTSHLIEKNMKPPAKYTKPDLIKEKPKEETIADYFTFYLERDVLGRLANLHLALCD